MLYNYAGEICSSASAERVFVVLGVSTPKGNLTYFFVNVVHNVQIPRCIYLLCSKLCLLNVTISIAIVGMSCRLMKL